MLRLETSGIYNLCSYDYKITQDRIAQYPLDERDRSKLLVIRNGGLLEHRIFSDIPSYLRAGDLLVLNDTKVIPARLKAVKDDTGGAVDILLIRDLGEGKWDVMLNRRLKPRQKISIINGNLAGEFINENGRNVIQFNDKGIREKIKEIGLPPLPPYIIRKDSNGLDRERYQTVYAEKEGSIAAPTAGLHFTDPLLKKLKELGVKISKITLHIGTGTFIPVKSEDIRHHRMEPEFYHIPEDTAEEINRAKADRRRIIAVGTTTTRVLESASEDGCRVKHGSACTNIFIYPGHTFRVIDGLITNFHLPKSTLFMLVSALAGLENIKKAYNEAIEKGYRFYSYGDAMLILRGRDA